MSKSNKRPERMIKYAYLRDERDPRRVMTIARRWGKNGNKMQYAYTICNPVEDQFRKATGRAEATARMETNPRKIRPEQGEFILRAIILDIATRNIGDDRSRNAIAMANQWLDENDRRDALMHEDGHNVEENEESSCSHGCDCGDKTFDNEELDMEDSHEELVEKLQAIRNNLGGGPLSGGRHPTGRSTGRRY